MCVLARVWQTADVHVSLTILGIADSNRATLQLPGAPSHGALSLSTVHTFIYS
jgi:hypothetical protein